MKLFFATLLSLILLLPSLGSAVIYTQFKIAQDEIAKTICVQRANINNTCNGRCELQKSLKKYEDNERRMDNTNLKEKTELVFIMTPTFTEQSLNESASIAKPDFYTPEEKTISVALSYFRPPSYFI